MTEWSAIIGISLAEHRAKRQEIEYLENIAWLLSKKERKCTVF
jgi:hypothetical protein